MSHTLACAMQQAFGGQSCKCEAKVVRDAESIVSEAWQATSQFDWDALL